MLLRKTKEAIKEPIKNLSQLYKKKKLQYTAYTVCIELYMAKKAGKVMCFRLTCAKAAAS